ncbi:MAG: hypothetical protein QNJ98_01720 [Planctomycetota bacterium]|nr:hypothetical protein [Planctomycetota bacterium]
MSHYRPVELILGRRPLTHVVAELRRTGVRFNAYAEALLESGQIVVASEPTPMLAEVHTVGSLGWPDGATLDQVIDNVAPQGLAPCPLEAALLLRLAWLERRPSPKTITVASRRAFPDADKPRGFYLRDDAEGCWLRGSVASDDWILAPDQRLVLSTT